jgi:hypothetical protein
MEADIIFVLANDEANYNDSKKEGFSLLFCSMRSDILELQISCNGIFLKYHEIKYVLITCTGGIGYSES